MIVRAADSFWYGGWHPKEASSFLATAEMGRNHALDHPALSASGLKPARSIHYWVTTISITGLAPL